jgi:hypothetical protein
VGVEEGGGMGSGTAHGKAHSGACTARYTEPVPLARTTGTHHGARQPGREHRTVRAEGVTAVPEPRAARAMVGECTGSDRCRARRRGAGSTASST